MMRKCFLILIALKAATAKYHRPTREDFLVKDLGKLEPAYNAYEGDMYAGVIPIDSFDSGKDLDSLDAGHLMFWMFDTDKPIVDDTLIMWFNGGPGCSSFHAGMMLEVSPVTTPLRPAGYYGGLREKDFPFEPNPWAWSNVSDIMFIEQPVGVGFSYGGTEPQSELDLSRDLYGFLQNFYDTFPEMRAKRLFLVGESYAGMYAPAIAHYIYQENKKLDKNRDADKYINLAGVALGNGWTDAVVQAPMVIDYAWWHGMIDSVTRDAFHEEWKQCYAENSDFWNKKQPAPFHSFTTPDECGLMEAVLAAAGKGLFTWGAPNTYDVTTWDLYSVLGDKNSTNMRFINDPRVQAAIHAPEHIKSWVGCIPGAGRRRRSLETVGLDETMDTKQRKLHLLDHDMPISVVPYLADLLDDSDVHVLVYNGDRDLSANAQGSESYLNKMEWSGSADWLDPHVYRRGVWLVDNYLAGYSKTHKNLNFLVVYNSGHLLPWNVPVPAFDLITRFITGESFIDKVIPPVFIPKRKSSTTTALPEDDEEEEEEGWDEALTPAKIKDTFCWVKFTLAFLMGVLVSQMASRMIKSKRCEYERIATDV